MASKLNFLTRLFALIPFAVEWSAPVQGQQRPAFGSQLSYTAPKAFPVEAFYEYWNNASDLTQQPQPKVSDPTFPEFGLPYYPSNFTSPTFLPPNDLTDFRPLPPATTAEEFIAFALTRIQQIYVNPVFENDTCGRCLATLDVAQMAAKVAPTLAYQVAQQLCSLFNNTAFDTVYASECETAYASTNIGNIMVSVYSLLDVQGDAGLAFCNYYMHACPQPPLPKLNVSEWLTPKPDPLPPRKESKGRYVKVLHLSDFHLEPRYLIGAEAECRDYDCCRLGSWNPDSPNKTVFPAPRFGAFRCDTPIALALAAAQAIPRLTGMDEEPFAFGMFSGDMVPHDTANLLSIGISAEIQFLVQYIMKLILGDTPMYACQGNHDGNPEGFAISRNVPYGLGLQESWNYDHEAKILNYFGALTPLEASLAAANYGSYVKVLENGLKIISLNNIATHYVPNLALYFDYDYDPTGLLMWLINELSIAEANGERVLLLHHVPNGYSTGNSMPRPSDLYYQIIDRYSPHVIANIFNGHTHEDQINIFYSNNGSNPSAEAAQVSAWIAPSLTPLTNLNSGFRVYSMDADTGDVIDSITFISNVSQYSLLDQNESGPTYEFSYSAREAYGANISWPADAPLNATWWHLVTEQFSNNITSINTYYQNQGKKSVNVPYCNEECQKAIVCYQRSASVPLASLCTPGYTSVQG